MAPKNQTISYRPDIDGLRALAVIAVVFFHVSPTMLPGGYVGVDIFFVISGYLITSIIIKNLLSKTFSLKDFFIKRSIRIFPSLALVLIVTLFLGWWLLLPNEFTQLGKHVVSGAGFYSNVLLAREAGYFDSAAELKPLLHLWSLGVEEQYYIVWPFLLVIIWRIKRFLFPSLLILMSLSLLINILQISKAPDDTFYLLPSRFWELLIGALLAIDDSHSSSFSKKFMTSNIRAIIGLTLCCLPVFFFQKGLLYPGGWALIPTLGAVLLISSPHSWLNRNIFSSRLAVFIGLLSYPLYLWHWPLISYTEIVHGDENLLIHRALAAFIALILAFITYRYFEKNLKKITSSSIKKANATALLAILAVLIVGITGQLTYKSYITPLNNSKSVHVISEAIQEWDFPGRLKIIKIPNGLKYFSEGKKPEVLFMGDSHMEQYYPRIEEFAKANPQKTNGYFFVTKGGCPAIPGLIEPKRHPKCPLILDQALKIGLSTDVKTIVISSAWISYLRKDSDYYLEKDKDETVIPGSKGYLSSLQNLKKMIEGFTKIGKKVFLILPSPSGQEFDPRMMLKRSFSEESIEINVRSLSLINFMSTNGRLIKDLQSIATAAGAKVINPIESICIKGSDTCPTTLDGMPVYKDKSHLRPLYVKNYGNFIDRVFY